MSVSARTLQACPNEFVCAHAVRTDFSWLHICSREIEEDNRVAARIEILVLCRAQFAFPNCYVSKGFPICTHFNLNEIENHSETCL